MNNAENSLGQVELSGRSNIDSMAIQRAAENPQDRDCRICQGCQGSSTPNDLWRASWKYFFVPNRLLAVLIPIATATGLVYFRRYTREVTHQTYHVLCRRCASTVNRGRVLGALLRFVGLFAAICALGLTLAAASWWFIANGHDQQIIRTWIALPVLALALGAIVAAIGSRVSVPAAIRSLHRRPFHLAAFRRFDVSASQNQ